MSSDLSSSRLDWRLLAHYLKPHRLQVVALTGILVGTIAVQLATPFVAARFIDQATGGATTRELLAVALLTLALALLGQGLAVTETWVAERLAWSATNALREDLTAHLLHMDAAFHHTHAAGELIERVDGDVGTMARLLSRFSVYVVGNVILILAILGLLFSLDWHIGIGVTTLVAVALAAILRLRAGATRFSVEERQAAANAYGFLGEYLSGLEDIRALGARRFVMRRWVELARRWLAARTQAQMRGYAMVATCEGLFGLGLAFALAMSAWLFRDGTLTIGSVFLVFRYTEMLRQPTNQIRNEIQDLQQAGASLNRIGNLLARRSAIVDGPGHELPPGPFALDLDGVWFAYGASNPVLRDVTLHIAPGKVLGIIGRTGSGKTTLTRLIPRFHDPVAGVVRLNGVDLRTMATAAVRARIGIVTQAVHLFDASLRDNLTLFDDDVPEGRLIDVLGAVGLGAWFDALPDGLETALGAGALGLSSGQAQVLACARVLLRDPDLVILDEPSSRLDPATERLIHDALARLLIGRTGVIVAHRLQTFDLADDVLILEDGVVMEHGSRVELAGDPASRYAAVRSGAVMEVAS